MRIESLTLHDFKSYRDQTVDLSGVRLGSIVGANGAGKSSLLEAALFALTGARGLRNLDSFIRQGAEECRVSLVFSMGEERYRVTRTRSSRNAGKSTVELAREENGAWVAEGTGPRETDERIAAVLGIDEDTLLLTSVVGQGDAGSFFALQPAKRLEAFAAILRLDEQYGPLERHWKTQADDLRAGLEDSRREIARLEGDAVATKARAAELANAREQLATGQTALAAAEAGLEAARKAAEKARENARLLEQAAKLTEELNRLNAQVAAKEELEAQLAERDAVLCTIGALETEEREAAEVSKARAVVEADLRSAKAALAETRSAGTPKAQEAERLTTQIRGLEERLENIRGTETPVCDRCGQAIADAALERTTKQLSAEAETTINRRAQVSQEAEELRTRYAEQQEQVKALEQQLADMPAPRSVAGDLQDAKHRLSLLDAIPAQLAVIGEAEKRCAEVRAELEALGAQGIDAGAHTDTSAAEADMARLQGIVEGKRNLVTVCERDIARHEEAIAMLTKSAEQLQGLRSQIRVLAESYVDTELLRKAFSKWGIPSLIVGNVLAALEREVNELLGLYDGGLAVRFESEKETRDGTRDSLEILVYDGQDWRPFETYSGGEKYRVASAMRLGLALLLAHRSGARVETLILDEPEGLDIDGRAHLVKILEHLSAHFGLVLVLSHYDDLKEALPSQIRVGRNGSGLSEVEVTA